MGNGGRKGDRGERFCYAEKGSPRGELAPVRATERGLQFLRLIVITPLRLDKLGTSPQGEAFLPLAVLYKKRPEVRVLADLRPFRLRKNILC